MIPPIPQDYLQMLTADRGVSAAELEALLMALGGQSTAEIATQLGISNIAVRKRLGEVYRKFNIIGAGPGKLAELRHQLLSMYQSGTTQGVLTTSAQPATSAVLSPPQRKDLSEAPDVPVFYGRSREMGTLEQWILQDNCRLIALLGLDGMGKTTLSVQIAKQIQDEYEFVFWQSLRNAPSVDDLLGNLIQLLSNQRRPELPGDTNSRVARLCEYFRKHKCLLVLDDFETLLQSEELAGQYRKGYEKYREVLKRIAETNHNSCLMLISSEKPADLALLEGEKVRALTLTGSEEIGLEIMREKGLSGQQQDRVSLIKNYGGNPLAIKIVSSIIQEVFNGNVSGEILITTIFSSDLRYLLDRQFERLSQSEKEIMYWLAIESEPLDLTALREESLFPISQSDLLKTLASLDRRSLIEKITEGGETLFTLQPLIMKYALSQFVDQVFEEVQLVIKTQKTEKLEILRSHTLSHGKKISNADLPQVLKLIKQKLEAMLCKNPAFIDDQIEILTQVLSKLEGKSRLEVRYAGENIRTLLSVLKEDLKV